MTASVLYVVPTFNRAGDLPRTLRAIAAQRWPDDRKSILVVDNASTDDTTEVLAALARELPFPLEHLRKKPEGPTVARNIGLRRGQDGHVALVDSDVELDPGWTEAAAAALEADPGLAQVGGKLLFAHERGMLNSYGGCVNWLGLAWDRGEGAREDEYAEARETLWINTSAVLMRPAPVLALGGFDELFFYAYEEPDLGLRLALAGWRALVHPGARAWHHVNREIVPSHPELVFHYCKNRVRMVLKLPRARYIPLLLAINLLYGTADALLHKPRAARWRALWWNIVHLRPTWRERGMVQRSRSVSDRDLLAQLEPCWTPPRRLRAMRRRVVTGTAVSSGTDDRVGVETAS